MLRSDWFPVALHYRDGGFRFPGGNVERCAFNDAKGGVCNRSHALVADRLAGSKAWYLIVDRDNPHAVVGVGWDIQAQTDRVSGLKRFTGHADSIKFVRRQRALDVSQFCWIRNLGVWGHRLNRVYKFAVLSACNRPFLQPLSGLLEAWISGQDVALLTAELRRQTFHLTVLQSYRTVVVVQDSPIFGAVLGVHFAWVVNHEDNIGFAVVVGTERIFVPLARGELVIPLSAGYCAEAVGRIELWEDSVKSVQLAPAGSYRQLHYGSSCAASAEHGDNIPVRFDGYAGLSVFGKEQTHPLVFFSRVHVNGCAKRMRCFIF